MVNMMRSGIMRLDNGGTVPWYVNILGSKGDGETPEEKARREFLENWFKNHSLAVPTGQENYDPFAGDTDKAYELWLVYNYEFPGTVPDPTTPTPTPTPTPTTPTPTTPTPTTTTPGAIEEITVTEMEQNGFPPGLTEVFVGGVLFSLIGSGSTGYWVNEAGDMYNPDGTPKDGVQTVDNSTIDEITSYGTQPDSMWSEIDWSSISDWGGLASILSTLGISLPGLDGDDGGGEDNWFDKLIDLVAAKDAYEEGYKYEVPTDQMDAQSAIGKQWDLPSRESMVMQGLGPNFLQDQKYVMNKGKAAPAATHVGGLPLVKEKIESGEQGGIMGLKSHGDITPAFLEPGEFVFTKKATDNVGAKRLYKLMQQAEQMGMR